MPHRSNPEDIAQLERDAIKLHNYKDNLAEAIAAKKKTINGGAVGRGAANDKALSEAAEFGIAHNIEPFRYVQVVWDATVKNTRSQTYFNPKSLVSKEAKKAITDVAKEVEQNDAWAPPLISTDSISYDAYWQYQLTLFDNIAKSHPNTSQEDILMDPTFKFFPWFRILATVEPNNRVITAYRKMALNDLNDRLLAFIKQNNLDLDRILCDPGKIKRIR